MKHESLSSKKPVTQYYLSNNTFSETSLIVVSSFDSLKEEGKKTLEFLIFSWDNPAEMAYPFIDRFDTARENMNALFEYRFSGPIKQYVLDKQYKYHNSRLLKEDTLEFTLVERNVINSIAFPYGLRLLEIIIIATDSKDLKTELSTLRDFILLVNNPDWSN